MASQNPDPAEDQAWRVGTHYAIHVYEGDRPVATFHTVADADRAVNAVNDSAGFRAALASREEVVKAAKDVRDWLDRNTVDGYSWQPTSDELYVILNRLYPTLDHALAALPDPDKEDTHG